MSSPHSRVACDHRARFEELGEWICHREKLKHNQKARAINICVPIGSYRGISSCMLVALYYEIEKPSSGIFASKSKKPGAVVYMLVSSHKKKILFFDKLTAGQMHFGSMNCTLEQLAVEYEVVRLCALLHAFRFDYIDSMMVAPITM